MLRACSITSDEQPFPVVDAYSGARFSAIYRDGERLIIKRINLADEWPLAAEHDPHYREAQFAVAGVALPEGVQMATIAASHDGDGRALLMRDVSDGILTGSDVVSTVIMDGVLARLAALHGHYWDQPPLDAPVSWCAHDRRITLLSPRIARMLIEEGRDFGVERGWHAFARLRPALWKRVERLMADPSPLVAAMGRAPQTLLHGDPKLGNMAFASDRLTLLDWSMVTIGPVGTELGWFLAVNSSRLPWSLEETLDRYARGLRRAIGDARWEHARWHEQEALAAATGVMLYGWGKALDFEADGSPELDWWCEQGARAFETLAL